MLDKSINTDSISGGLKQLNKIKREKHVNNYVFLSFYTVRSSFSLPFFLDNYELVIWPLRL